MTDEFGILFCLFGGSKFVKLVEIRFFFSCDIYHLITKGNDTMLHLMKCFVATYLFCFALPGQSVEL